MNNETIVDRVVCLYQLDKKYLIDLSNERHGDCRICTPDYKNKLCSGYYPITLHRIEVTYETKP